MDEEIKLLIEAVKSLKSEDDHLKDYIFPIAISFSSSLLGGAVAYFTFKQQDGILFEKEKMNIANKWIIITIEKIQTLQTIKSNYYEKLTSNPFERALNVPCILGQFSKVSEEYSNLSFISPSKKKGKPEYVKWSQIPRIQALFHNYNFLIDLWEKRNDLDQSIKSKLLSTYSTQAYGYVTEQMIIECINITDLCNLIDFTEKAVKLTDDLIIEMDDFLYNFPAIAKNKIKTK